MRTRRSSRHLWFPLAVVALVIGLKALSLAEARGGQGRGQDPAADPFKGVTTAGTVVPNLFPIRATGVSTDAVRAAADRFLAALTPAQRAHTAYPVDDAEWRKWNNVHRYARQGVSFKEMTAEQRERAFDLMRAGLSAKGFAKSRDIMRLNGYIAELRNNQDEYGEFLYHLTVMGTPSPRDPWGWQLDGHHLIVNYFVLGDQVVMTPTFMGSEPVSAETGQYAGTRVFEDEEHLGLALMQSLTAAERQQATLQASKTANNALGQAFRDNLVLDYAGLRVNELAAPQRQRLLALIGEYVGSMDDGHARVRMDEVRKHLDQTYFAWIGDAAPDSVFYYRVHGPVILIEFDHQTPVALEGPRVPGRRHVHTVVRTPNGNDYGKDLLRQHYQKHAGDPSHGHR
jgi:hypothetical protein